MRWRLLHLSTWPLSLRPLRRVEQTTKLAVSVGRARQYFLGTLIQDHLSIEITIVGLPHHYLLIYARSLLIWKAQVVMVVK